MLALTLASNSSIDWTTYSLRAVTRVLEFVASFFGQPFSAPDWTTGRI